MLCACCLPKTAWADTLPAPVNAQASTINIEVTARRWQEPLRNVPASVSVVTGNEMANQGMHNVHDASRAITDLTLPDFSARWLYFPFIRGIGSGRNTPAVTTVIDGVPQLSYITANQELLNVDHIEFLRGPQGSLYGRNTLAGVVNVVPASPTGEVSESATVTVGSENLIDARAGISGPFGNGLRGSLNLGYASRDGYTKNDVTGHWLDNQSAAFGHGQLLWPRTGPWDFRLSLSGERDRDGDYGLGDLAAIRTDPHHVAHDFEGFNRRDLAQPVFTAVHHGPTTDFTSVTAWQWYEVHDLTDADATPLNLFRSGTDEDQHGVIQEFRLASTSPTTTLFGETVPVRWLLGTLLFTTDNHQDNFTSLSAAAAQQEGVPIAFTQHAIAARSDTGVSPFAQVEIPLVKRFDLTLGLREDYQHKTADLTNATSPELAPANTDIVQRDFSQLSPQAALSYHLTPNALGYAQVSKGYKSGGFNNSAPAGKTAYGDETSVNYEAGVKAGWLRDRLQAQLSVFHLDWDHIQLDVPSGQPNVFFIDNAGKAASQGAELEVTGRPFSGFEIVGGVGLLDAAFKAGSQSGGVDVSGHQLPFAPHLNWHAGVRETRQVSAQVRAFAGIDLVGTGRYFYDATNLAAQGGYMLVNLNLGASWGQWRASAWVRNLLNKNYVPIAFADPVAPSGYLGESGAPRTFGVALTFALP